MSNSADPIFPLINRRAPLLDRFRDDTDSNRLSNKLASAIGEFVKSDDEEVIEESAQQLKENLASDLANSLGVSVEDIDTDYIEDLVSQIADADETTVLTEDSLAALGIKADEDVEEEDEEDESPSLFD